MPDVPTRFQMRCSRFDEMALGRGSKPLEMIRTLSPYDMQYYEILKDDKSGYSWNSLTSQHGVLVKESRWNVLNGSAGPLIRLRALESSLGNRTDGWLNVTQNISSDLASWARQ